MARNLQKNILQLTIHQRKCKINQIISGGNMPVVKEITEFKNSYYIISDFCHKYNEPVIITKNGESDIAVMNIKIYEEITGIRNLVNLLEEADKDIEKGNYLTEEEMDNKLDLLFKNA
ncbi:MAG: type II toxin-antitoxin system Phd/YefM family antitoxin [Treponema sp.]|nr:type II toxin-antitoxin system Phd/YefM family antitoxin [Treponema sp.]